MSRKGDIPKEEYRRLLYMSKYMFEGIVIFLYCLWQDCMIKQEMMLGNTEKVIPRKRPFKSDV